MKDEIHIVYGSDDNYWFPTAISAASAAWFAALKDKIVIHLFDAGVSDAHYQDYVDIVRKASSCVRLERHKLSAEMFTGFGSWRGSVVTYSRMFIADILSDLDWAIYVDGDTLWLGDPMDLWKMRDESQLVLASIDPPTADGNISPEFAWYRKNGLEIDPSKYLCMGLMLANLKLMREKGVPGRCAKFMEEYPCPRIVDQTVLNYVCKGLVKPLPANWGVFSVWHGGVDLTIPSLVHYCQDLPFNRNKINRLFSDVVLVWFEFCKRVLGRDEIKKFSWIQYAWRRGVFKLLQHMQPIVGINAYVHSRLRNTHGIPSRQYKKIIAKFN